jgi:hypothetical protein
MKREEVALVKAKKTESDYKQLFVEADDPNPDVARKYKEMYGDERFIWESKTDDFYFIMYVPRFCGIVVDNKRFRLCKYKNEQSRSNYCIISRHKTFKSAARKYIRIKRGLKPRKTKKIDVDKQIERHMKRVRRAF